MQEEEKDIDEAGPVIDGEEEDEAPASVRSTTALKTCAGLEAKQFVEEADQEAYALGMSVPSASL